MVYVVPGTLQISPASPLVGAQLTFQFTVAYDTVDYMIVPATSLHLYYRTSGTTQWRTLSSLTCSVEKSTNRTCCEGNTDCLAPLYNPTLTMGTIAGRPITLSAPGIYDFLVCDKSDLTKVQGGTYDFSRVASLDGIVIATGGGPAPGCTHGETKCEAVTGTIWQCLNGTWVNSNITCVPPDDPDDPGDDDDDLANLLDKLKENPIYLLIGCGALALILTKKKKSSSPIIVANTRRDDR